MSVINLILGRPLASSEQEETEIGVVAGVPAMGLDGLTSSAYGPEAALTALVPLGIVGLHCIGPIIGVIVALLILLYFSYRQTIAAYPVNGGSYTVAKENFGTWPGLVAAAALMIDYVLNVAVGISAGVAALVSAAPSLHRWTVLICLGVLLIITLLNLRGTGEAGLAFAVPTYLFLACMAVILGLGAVRVFAAGGHPQPVSPPPPLPAAVESLSLWLVLRAFASGCTAMTGVEAVSNGVNAFREPRVKNAHRTLTVIVAALALLLGGVALLARAYKTGAMPQDEPGYQSILSQITAAVVGRGTFYYVTMSSVLATLCLSANTSFVDFPRLCRLIAEDGFLPRAFATVGRRLVYSVGIIFLAAAAAGLLIAFRGVTDRLIPLFAVGAFGAFTLSQAGMVMHWRKERARDPNAKGINLRLRTNATGAAGTAIALVVILIAKFSEGAWITVLALPALLLLFRTVHRHYRRLEAQVTPHGPLDLGHNAPPVVLVPTRGWNRPTEKALRFAMWLSTDLIGVHLSNLSGEEAEHEEKRVIAQWAQNVEAPAHAANVPAPKLVVVQSPYRDFLRPLLDQIDKTKADYPGRKIAIVIPEVAETRLWHWILHARRPARLGAALLKREDRMVIVVNVPWYVED